MNKILVRHGLSFANDQTSFAFGSPEADLRPEGIEQSIEAGERLRSDFLADPYAGVATSYLLRTKQSACCAGFVISRSYSQLNEVDISGYPNIREILDKGIIITEAYEAAERVLNNPPKESVWFTHGYLIMAIGDVLGIQLDQDLRMKPRFGEIRTMKIDA